MSKKVNMIAGFEALRGNISGKQKLQYPKDGKGAYESVMNKKNYATNYRTSYVVAKRASDGLVYFQVRQRSCNHLTAKSKKAMAVLGGTGAIVGAILADKSASLYTQLMGAYEYSVAHNDNRTFRQFLHASISRMLKNYQASITIANAGGSATIDNPWMSTSETPSVTISESVLLKFFTELVQGAFNFTVDGAIGLSRTGLAFHEIVENTRYNVLGLTVDAAYVYYQGRKLTFNGSNVSPATVPTVGQEFQTAN